MPIHAKKCYGISAILRLAAGVALLVFGYMTALEANANSPGPESDLQGRIATLATELTRASAAGDVSRIKSLRDEFAALAGDEAADEKSLLHIRYFLSAADFRAGSIDRSGGRDFLERCVSSLAEVLAGDNGFAEGHILQAACAGNLISAAPDRVLELSMLSQRSLQLAREIDPENPRAAFVEGLSILFTPQNFGGGPKMALARFEDSVRYFEADKGSSGPINWGKDEAYMWLGIALSINGQPDAALEALKRSAALNPEDRWISEMLIPRVEAGKSLGEIFGIK